MIEMRNKFDHKKLNWPNILYIKYKYKNKKHAKFADGSNVEDYAEEQLKINYEIDDDVNFMYLLLGHECIVEAHCGGVDDYEIKVLNFNTTCNQEILYQDFMIAACVMSYVTQMAEYHKNDKDYFYESIIAHLKSQ